MLTVIPRYTWAMTEGRSYALSSTLAILATLLLVTAIGANVRLLRKRALMLWAAYTAICVTAITCFAYLALLFIAHALTMLVLAHRREITTSTLRTFTAAIATTAALTMPLLLIIAGQSGQVAWIRPPGWHTIGSVLITQFSPDNSVFAGLAFLLFGIAALLRAFRRCTPSRRAAVVYDRVAGHPGTTARIIANSYPTSFASLWDVDLTAPYTTAATLWDSQDVVQPNDLRGLDASWLIASRRRPPTAAILAITTAGMTPTRTWHLSDVDITYFTRTDG
jgi:hypothetical protein